MKIIKFYVSVLLLILSSTTTWSETVTMNDLVETNGLFYKKFTDVPFSGEISGIRSGKFFNGKMEGLWKIYYESGRLKTRVNYKDGSRDGPWESFFENGQVWQKFNYKDGRRDGLWETFYENLSYGRKKISKTKKETVLGNTFMTMVSYGVKELIKTENQ